MVQVRLLAILGHVDIRRDPSCPAQSPALRFRAACSWNAWCESSEGVFIAAVGRVRRFSTTAACEHSRASAVRSLKTREACRLSRLTGSCSQPCVPSRLGNQTGQRSRIYARERMPLSLELAESESLQMVVVSIRGRNGIRVCTCEICHRFVYASVYGGQENGVDVARIRPGDHRCHT